MPTTPAEILQAALQLSESDRLTLADRLLATLPQDFPGLSDDADEFEQELDRRSGDSNGAVRWEDLRDESR